MMNRVRVLLVIGLAAVLPSVSFGQRELPAVADVVPAESPLVIAAGSADALDAASAELLQASGLTTLSTFKQVLTVFGVRQTMDTARGLTVALVPIGVSGDAAVAALVPVTSFEAFAEGLNAGAGPAGVRSFTFAGAELFMDEVRGADGVYAAVSGRVEALADGVFIAGQNAERAELLGGDALEVAADSTLVAVLRPEALRPALRSIGERERDAMVGRWARRMLGFAETAERFAGPMLGEAEAAVIGVRLTPRGIIATAIAEPAEGSGLGEALVERAAGGAAADGAEGLLAGLPEGPWLIAGGVAASDPVARRVLERLDVWFDGLGSVAWSWYLPGGGGGEDAGRGRPLVLWDADSADRAVAMNAEFEERSAGWLIEYERREGEATVGGRPADGFALGLPVDASSGEGGSGAGPNVSAIASQLAGFGEGGVWRGVVATRGRFGVASTDASLAAGALDDAAGSDPRRGLASDRIVRAARRLLPRDRVMEFVVNPSPVASALAPVMRLRGFELENPRRYPPIAVSGGVGESGETVKAVVFVPAAAIQNAFVIGQATGAIGSPTDLGAGLDRPSGE